MASKLSAVSVTSDMPRTIYLTEKELPDIKDWEVGKKYGLELSVRQVSRHEDEKGGVEGSFAILKAESDEETPAEENDEEKKESKSPISGGLANEAKKMAKKY